MAKGKNRDYVSFWFWMFALFVTALPCIGFIMVIVWAFVGENESRKNYFKALIAWFLIVGVLWGVIMTLGLLPLIEKQIETWTQHSTNSNTKNFTAINAYIEGRSVFLHEIGFNQVKMRAEPSADGGQILISGTVPDRITYDTLVGFTASHNFNPDLPAKIDWKVTIQPKQK